MTHFVGLVSSLNPDKSLMRSILFLFFFVLNVSLVGAGVEPCERFFSSLFFSGNLGAPQEFRSWSKDSLPKVHAADFLPATFIKEIESQIGPVSLEIYDYTSKARGPQNFLERISGSYQDRGQSIREAQRFYKGEAVEFVLRAHGEEFGNWGIVYNKENPSEVMIEGLKLENPMNKAKNLHLSQTNKGLPIDVFSHAKERLFSFLRAGGVRSIKTVGPQNYAVNMLYRKLVNMEAASYDSQVLQNQLDNLYQFAKKKLPQDVRIKTLNDFSQILGDFNDPLSVRGHEVKLLWKRRNGTIPQGLEPLRENGDIIGLIDRRSNHDRPAVFFLNPHDKDEPILYWERIRTQISLQRNI